MDGIPLGPVYTWRAARDRGITRGQIATDGVSVARGLYLSRAVEPTPMAMCRAWALALPDDAAFSHATAAALYGAPVTAPRHPHVALTPRRVLPQWDGLVVHRRRMLPEDVVEHHGLRLTSGPQTYLDLAAVLPAAELVAVGDGLLRAGHLTPESLVARLARADRVRGVVRARECATVLSPLAMSRPESLIRYWVSTSRLPAPQPQVPIRDRWGHVLVHGDLGYEEWKLVLEYEGRQHADADQFGRDIDRYSLMAADGWTPLRFASRHLNRSVVVSRTKRALISRGWRPPPQPPPC
jgi:hypothetical protein